MRRLRLKDIAGIPIPLPGRELQNKIKTAYDDVARLSQESETELSQIIQAVHAEIDRKTQMQATTRRFKIRKNGIERPMGCCVLRK